MIKSKQINLIGRLATKRGTTRSLHINLTQANLNFSNATIEAKIARRNGSDSIALFSVSYVTRAIGQFSARIDLSSTQTEALPVGLLYWQCFVKLTNAIDPVLCVAEGNFEVTDQIDD